MTLDPNRSVSDWHTWLREEAERVWGQERASILEPALQRMASAVQRVVVYGPHAETRPHQVDTVNPYPTGGQNA